MKEKCREENLLVLICIENLSSSLSEIKKSLHKFSEKKYFLLVSNFLKMFYHSIDRLLILILNPVSF